jgi:hypothetical protein
MGNVNAAAIWTPDEGDNLDPEVWSAAMADSIMNGIGERLSRQERFEGCYLNIQDPTPLVAGPPGTAQTPLPFVVGQSVSYIDGDMTLSGGVITVAHAGLYSVSTTIASDPHDLGYLELTLFRNLDRHGQVIFFDDGVSDNPHSLSHATVMKCVPGDTIWASGFQYFGDYGNPPELFVDFPLFNTMTVTLVQAF